jgi:hypothetical protein
VAGVSVQVKAPELVDLHRKLKELGGRELLVIYRKALRKAAEPLAVEVRQRYSAYSTRLPRAVRIKVKGGGRVVLIEVGGTRTTPHARTVEGLPSGGPARHPVFAKGPRSEWTWVAQTPPRQIVAQVVNQRSDAFVRDVVRRLDAELDQKL